MELKRRLTSLSDGASVAFLPAATVAKFSSRMGAMLKKSNVGHFSFFICQKTI
jgi:hypothetical protein